MLELNIPEQVSLEAKIRKLVVSVHDVKIEVARVQFDLNLRSQNWS